MTENDTGIVARGNVTSLFKDFADMSMSEGCRYASLYGEAGTGKSTLLKMIKNTTEDSGSEYSVFFMDAAAFCGSYPEQGLINLRNSCKPEHKDFFTLFDISILVRSEKINGRLPMDCDSFFSPNSSIMADIFKTCRIKTDFTRNMYEEVGKSLPRDWFDKTVRPYITKIFTGNNQQNWTVPAEAFAACLNELKNTTGLAPLIIIDNAESLINCTDDGLCWINSFMSSVKGGIVLYASESKLPAEKYGVMDIEIPVEGFSSEEAVTYLKAKGFTRDALAEVICENTSGNPALISYCAETFNLLTKSEGHEPGPDAFQSDPQSVVHMHLSAMDSVDSSLAKILSCAGTFDFELFRSLTSEFVPDVRAIDTCFDSFINHCFIENYGDDLYSIHPLYRAHAMAAVDSDLLENVNYAVYRYHMREAESRADKKMALSHIRESVIKAMTIMDIDGFTEWFATLEKNYYNVEAFNFWLDMLEKAKAYISGVLGETSPVVAAYFDKLAFMYLKSGRTASAERVLQKRLNSFEEKSGKNTADTVPMLNKLAGFYSSTGDFAAAESIAKKGLEIREQFLGKNSADYADSKVKLGKILLQEGKRDEAVKNVDEASEIYDKTLDVKDPSRIEADELMASVYSAAGHIAKAAIIYHKITSYKNEQFGPFNEEAMKSLKDYAEIVFKSGNGKKAVKLYEDLISKTKKIYGENSRMTAAVANDLALAYQNMQEYDKSETMHNEALNIKRQVYGTNHPSTAVSFTNYGKLKYVMGDLKNAEPYYYKALQIYELVFGERHERTAAGLNNMGFITSRMGQFDRAEEYYKKALEIKTEIGGEKSVSAAAAMNNLGELLYRIGKKAEAKEFLSKALDIYNDLLGAEHEYSKIVAKNLAAVG